MIEIFYIGVHTTGPPGPSGDKGDKGDRGSFASIAMKIVWFLLHLILYFRIKNYRRKLQKKSIFLGTSNTDESHGSGIEAVGPKGKVDIIESSWNFNW